MRRHPSGVLRKTALILAVLLACRLYAHENHAPLPTKGVKIVGDQVMISAKGRDAIGLTTAKIALADLSRMVSVNSRVELPWRQQAMVASLVPGKIEQVLVRPGKRWPPDKNWPAWQAWNWNRSSPSFCRSRTEVALAARVLQQRTTLEQQGVVPGKSLLEARAAHAQKVAQREIARQKLLALGLSAETLKQLPASGQTLGWLPITSPIAGTIAHADVRVGQAVQTSDHLYHVVDLSSVWVVGGSAGGRCRPSSQGP